ncbi:hypothetical protein J2T12_003572 [Paenibacillus anaericanus]|nr:hypothetical protein [Paenibacillus anaericanus]
MEAIRKLGIIKGIGAIKFAPHTFGTRAEAAAILQLLQATNINKES